MALPMPAEQQSATSATPERLEADLQQRSEEAGDAASSVQQATNVHSHNADAILNSPDALAQGSEAACSDGLRSPRAAAVADAPGFHDAAADPVFDGMSPSCLAIHWAWCC